VESKVFISYANADRATAVRICERLERAGISCWIAPRDIDEGSESWAASIDEAIERARVFVLVYTASSNASVHVHREVKLASDSRTIVIPFRIDDVPLDPTLRYLLALPQWLDASVPPIDSHLDRLARVIEARLRPTVASESAPPEVESRRASDEVAEPPGPAHTQSAGHMAEPTPPVAIETSSQSLATRKKRTSVLLGFAALLVVVAAVVVVAIAPWSGTDPTAAGGSSTTTTTATATTTTSPAQNAALRLAVVQLDQLLRDAKTGFTNLNDHILTPFNACQMSGVDAAQRTDGVISNRQNILNSLNALKTADPTAATLVASMRHALQISLDSDFAYRDWLGANSGVDCPRYSTPDKVRADELGGQATPAKQEFAASYNPVAALFGLKSDWDSQF
jgi:hypothetical protein